MDNKAISGVLYETADLQEIDGQDSFRIRSYRNAAQAIENSAQQMKDIIGDPAQVLAIPGIGKKMLLNLQELLKDGKLSAHAELLKKYHPSMLQLLKIQGLGPKTIALIWSAYQVSDVDGVEKLAREGKIRELPRMGEKHEAKLLKAIEDYRRVSGRFLIDAAETEAEKLTEYLSKFPGMGIDKITSAGSLRRGRETVGDLDISSPARPALRKKDARKRSPMWRSIRRSSTSSPAVTTKSVSTCAAGCRSMFACSLPILSARPCSISPARRRTTWHSASAR
jgi:DNA polymerase (family 10)